MIKKIKVGGINYEVVYPYPFVEDTSYIGLHQPINSKIFIADEVQGIKRKTQMIYRTLMHEIFHAIDRQYCGSVLDEESIDKLTNAWYNIIRNNDLFSKKLAKRVNIYGIYYDIMDNHKFSDVDACFITNNEELTIKFTKCDKQYRQCATIVAIHQLLCEDIELELPEGSETFGNGIYQVMIDSRLDKQIRSNKI